jgi:Na+/phosphate symporter
MPDDMAQRTTRFSEKNLDMLIEVGSKSKSLQKILKNLRKEPPDRLNKKECDIMAGLLYTDILTALNNIRTDALNIVEATAGLRKRSLTTTRPDRPRQGVCRPCTVAPP